jgi:hypothetical protein
MSHLNVFFFACRFLIYGTEIAKYGYIKNFYALIPLWEKMKKEAKDLELTSYEKMYEFYYPKIKEYKHNFSIVCPYLVSYSTIEPKIHHKFKGIGDDILLPKDNYNLHVEIDTGVKLLHCVKYIHQHGIKKLVEDFNLILNIHTRYNNLFLLHHSQHSDKNHIITKECSGIILDANKNWEVVSMPYMKFFEYNDKNYNDNDFKYDEGEEVKVYEKIDGTLAVLYFYDNSWQVASSYFPDGKDAMCYKSPEHKVIFNKYFWDIFNKKGYKIPIESDMNFFFEMITPHHLYVVQYKEEDLILHGARNIKSMKEEDHKEYALKYGWNYTKEISISKPFDLNLIINMAKNLDATLQEGFVIRDKSFNRIKVKSPDYIKLTYMYNFFPDKTHMNEKNILDIIRKGEEENFIKYCPEWRNKIEFLKIKFEEFIADIEKSFEEFKQIEDLAEFSKKVKTHRYKNAFNALKFGSTIREYLAGVGIKKLLNEMGVQIHELRFE